MQAPLCTVPISNHRRERRAILLTAAILAGVGLSFAEAGTGVSAINTDSSASHESALAAWWNGKTLTGNWFGVRDTLKDDYGLKLGGKYYGAFFGVVDSQNGSRGFWDQGIEFSGEQNFGKLFNAEALEGLTAFGGARWRDSRQSADPNQFVEASSMFNPSNWISGTQWRLLSAGLQYTTGNDLPVEDAVILRAGWLQPQKEFVDQPLSKLFLNNAINSSKGIGGNIPFSSSFSTWGGTIQVKPVEWHYAKAGLFMSYPSATASSNHGLAFQGFARDTSRNGLFAIGEVGVTPKIGPAELPGRYAFGGYYYEQENTSYFGSDYNGFFGFYWQADQVLFREPTHEPTPVVVKGPSDGKSFAPPGGKSFKEPVIAADPPALNQQGLSTFNLLYVAPKYNNQYSFYFQSGLVYQGLIPTRDDDLTLIAIGYGAYSFNQIQARQDSGVTDQPNYTGVIEGGYRFQINQWAFLQPFVQYIFHPNGTRAIANDTILGFSTGAAF